VKTLQYWKKLHPFENADKISKYPDKYTQPDSKTPAGAYVTSYHKNIQALALAVPLTALVDTAESESCSNESVSTGTVDANKESVDPHMNGMWQVVKSKKLHHW
jgi:hypothetical protein